ncbi:MAG: hypothetical protein GY856_44945 [bacterium]|nr:hypothetical protein [bacterium]
MRRLLYLPAILLLCALGCDSGNPVAPTGTVLTMVASSTQIGLHGSTLITVTGFRPDGNPLYPGTQIIFSLSGSTSTSGGGGGGGTGGGGGGGVGTNSGIVVQPNSDGLGAIEPTVAEIDDSGRATAVFTSDGRAGSVTITGTTTTSDASASVTVQIGETAETKPTLSITANPETIALSDTSTISVIARNADGSVYGAGGQVRLGTSLGELDDEELVTDAQGEAETTLRSGTQTGTATVTGSIGASDEVTVEVAFGETSETKPTLSISANPSAIGLNETSAILVIARNADGSRYGAGGVVRLRTSLGELDDEELVTDSQGEAETTLRPGTQPGTATVTGSIGASDEATADVAFGETTETRPTLSINVNPSAVGLNETSTISIVARNADGSRYGAGGVVQLSTTLGTLASEELVTNSQGEAETTLDSGSEPGEATITGSIGASDEVTATVTIENRKPTLEIFANPSSIAVGNQVNIRILARDHNGQPLGAGRRISLFADLGSIPDSADTDENGEAEAIFDAGLEAGTATITAILDNSDPATVSVQIRDAAADVQLTANPSSIARGDVTINLTAVVRNAQGVAVPSILVTFNAEVGILTSGGTGVQTNTRGEATDVLTVTQSDLPAALLEFDVTATVISEGNEITGSATIQIQQ